ncbi:MAG: hypothetical protein RR346_09945 [Bacteroidales bacterium]
MAGKKPKITLGSNDSPSKLASKLNTRGFDGMFPPVDAHDQEPEVSKEQKEEAKKVRTSLYISKDHREQLNLAADNEGVSISAVVMAALDSFFADHPEMIKEKRKKAVNWDKFK